MRLLNTTSLSFKEFHGEISFPYAILSHRWEDEEVSLQEMQSGRACQRKGYAKIKACCRLARSHGYKYVWIDTCCIDKTSSAELLEAINSMFRWYQRADKCFAYLSDVSSSRMDSGPAQKDFSSSAWFTRGWTLQELIAPRKVLFYNRSWEYLGSKSNLRLLLSKITSIDPDVLMGKISLSECPIAQRMSWAAKRTTTRLEDRAYSLLGIFNVHMGMIYGEGERAFQRLQEEIIKQSDDHSLFAWNDERFAKSVLAPSPSCFAGLGDLARVFPTKDTSQGFQLKNAALSISLQLVPWSMNTYLAPLRCGHISALDNGSSRSSFRGYDRACIFLQQTDHQDQFIRISVSGEDLVVLSGDHIAETRDKFGFSDRQILIHQLFAESYIRPAEAGFYGFVFSFQHSSMFTKGRRPNESDIVCAHKCDLRRPVFQIEDGQHHMAGMFRLSTGHHMYFGFDRDFGPLCLVTTLNPRSRRFSRLESDFQKLTEEDALRLLDLNWLRAQIEEGTDSGHAILAFKGERRTRTEVECNSLSLHLVFDWRYSELTKMQSWHVEFHKFEPSRSRDNSPSLGRSFETTSAGFTSPSEVSRLATMARSASNRNNRMQTRKAYPKPPASLRSSPRSNVVDDGNDVVLHTATRYSHFTTRPTTQTDDLPRTPGSARSPGRPTLFAASEFGTPPRSPGIPNIFADSRVRTRTRTSDDKDARKTKPPDQPSGPVIRTEGADGNTVIRRAGVSLSSCFPKT